jgi:D-glycero-D-manno-heptose 1,7-bisphosphate phosphatase
MKYIVLDRDGVINQDSDDYIKSLEEWIPVDGSIEAIASLSQAGFRVAVASNQSGIGRGYFDIGTLNQMHDRLLNLVSDAGGHIEGIFFCPHTPDENCECRKPKPGLLLDIQRRLQFNLDETIFVGDSLKDIEVALAVNAKPILVKTGKGERTLADPEYSPENYGDDFKVYDDLQAFAVDFLKKSSRKKRK